MNIDFECASFEELEVPDGSVDVVLALSLLHLLDDWRGAVARIHGMLKPDGVFVSSTACMNDAARFLRPLAGIGRAVGLLPQLSFFDRTALEVAIADAGFRIEHAWRPSPKQGLFVVARKGERGA